MRRRVALFAAALLVAVVVGPSPARAVGVVLLPDLRQAPVGCAGGYPGDPARCLDWDVCPVADAAAPNGPCVQSGPIGAVRLRFTTSADNVGDGPLVIHGRRSDVGQERMTARQALQSAVDGSIPMAYEQAQHAVPAALYYEPAAAHQHWHLLGFEHFQLRTPAGDTVVIDRKNGFCLGDRYATADRLANRPVGTSSPQGALAAFLRENRCGHHAPEALSVVQGISVGYGDDYLHTVDFQWLDISTVPSGVYDVVNIVNGDRTLVEKSYANNASSMAISIRWPGDATTPPTTITRPPDVRLLRNCPGALQCATPRG
ncbi:lysyl oxidase [Saccharothrix sp. S26]|uniref:lysyl oxidase family protein n=1 Tax=Saccharothrix sp. S26 TaxID=2907215 RepID=UPI001F441880|nr:lysyl oxidase family protein [Saccharothrix sp. S26]MCE7000474.1 lysyl oxidase [Saccharothrix sp. S26]